MKITSVCNQKGGVGKTTTAVSLAAGLARRGEMVLCIDFDPQGNLSDYLGYAPEPGGQHVTISDLMLAAAGGTLTDAQISTAIQYNSAEQIYYIPSSIKLSSADLFLAQAMFREQILKRILGNPFFVQYDHIIIDCLPSLGILLTNALIASHSLIIPVQAQKFALSGIEDLLSIYQLVKQQANPSLKIDGILMTMVDNTNMAKAVEAEVRDRFPEQTFSTVIRRSVDATNSTYEQKSLVNSRSALGRQYEAVVGELLSRKLRDTVSQSEKKGDAL